MREAGFLSVCVCGKLIIYIEYRAHTVAISIYPPILSESRRASRCIDREQQAAYFVPVISLGPSVVSNEDDG